MLPINCPTWQLQLPQLPKSCQQWELIFLSILAFRATKILSNLRASIPVASELCDTWKMLCFASTVGVVNCSIQSYLKPGRCYSSCQLSEFTTSFQSYFKKQKHYQLSLQPYTKTLQNFCCQIEVSFIIKSFLIGKPWNFRQIHVRSLELPNYTIMLLSPLP